MLINKKNTCQLSPYWLKMTLKEENIGEAMLESRFMKFIDKFEISIIIVLMLLMVFTILISSVELGVLVFNKLQEYPRFFIGIDSLLEIFGQFLIVLIGIELLETIKSYLHKNVIRVEIVIMVSIIAVVRKIIIIDLKSINDLKLIGIALLVTSLSVGYYLIKKTK